MTTLLYGVGLGPGDPELVTRKAARLVESADVVAYHSGTHGRSIARGIADAAGLLHDDVVEEALVYPVTTGTTDHPGGYAGAIRDFYDECAERLARHLRAGRQVAVLCEGDPLFYGSYMYLHDRLADHFPTEVVPGVTSVSAASAAAAAPLVRQTDVLSIVPGTLPEAELTRRLADSDGAAVMKLGRTFSRVRSALTTAGRLSDAVYVERASTGAETCRRVEDVDPASVPYFSIILVPGDTSERPGTRPAPATPAATGELLVVGLGPAGDEWTTPEAAAALAEVDHVVGYAPYVRRIPHRAGLQRHASGNTVEGDRARFALDLALRGEHVAVVSGGDAGVFGMAAAVFEAADAAAAEDAQYAEVSIRVLPGVTAAQAVAARAGAPLGGDFCVMSLSDRLKPWALIERRLRAAAAADLALVIYNPASKSRTTQMAVARSILREHRPGDTLVVVGRDVGRAHESLLVTTLADLDPATVDMRCLVIVGSSGTTVSQSGHVWTRRWSPEAMSDGVAGPPGDPVGSASPAADAPPA